MGYTLFILLIISITLFLTNPKMDTIRGRDVIWYTNPFTQERKFIKL